MRFSIKERALSAAVVVTAAVVIALAVLQYRWSNEASEATAVRLADTLQLSMINWHLDFLRNFSEVCLAMRIDPEGGMDADLDQYARRLGEWKTIARYPDLVSSVYLLKADKAGPRALRLDPGSQHFVPDDWPSQFRSFVRELKQASFDGGEAAFTDPSSESPSQPFGERFYDIGDALKGWRFEPSIPALFHPIQHASTAGPPERSNREAADWMAIDLNAGAIQKKILPDLAHRYFQGTDGLDYQVAVVAGFEPAQLLYSSDSGFGQQAVLDADGTMDLFGRVRDKAVGSPINVFHLPSANKGPAASVGIGWFPLLRSTPENQDWQLMVRHRRGGPLGAFVADMHRRDLAVSFGALLLLVISMAMLIIASNRAQRLARLQMDFVTAVSHELRTPLTVISSAADNIAQGVVASKEQLTQYGSVIGDHVRQLSGLVEEILLFATTNNGRQRFHRRPLDVSEIVDLALASTAGLVRAAKFTIERDVEPGLPRVVGDLLALSQCLQNLITNALKYGREERWIGIRAGLAEHDAGGTEVQVSISDRGMGISSTDLPHIFEPFYRSPSVAAAQIHGTGLGLSLAKRIAEAMKGQLTVTSVHGRGSTFILHLPLAEQASRQADVELGASVVSSAPPSSALLNH